MADLAQMITELGEGFKATAGELGDRVGELEKRFARLPADNDNFSAAESLAQRLVNSSAFKDLNYKTKVASAKPSRDDVVAARLDDLCGTASYLQLRGTPMPPAIVHPDAQRGFGVAIPPAKAEARLRLAVAMQGHTITKYPPGVAAVWRKDSLGLECGYGRLSGVSSPIGVGAGKTSAPRHSSLSEIDRSDTASDFTGRLSEREQAVLDAIMQGDSFAAVAKAAGKSATSHNGKRVVLKELRSFSEKLAA